VGKGPYCNIATLSCPIASDFSFHYGILLAQWNGQTVRSFHEIPLGRRFCWPHNNMSTLST